MENENNIQRTNIRNAQDFYGVYPAIITPMDVEGNIDYPKLYNLIDDLIENNVNGIVACGTTGQSSNLNCLEHVNLAHKINQYIDGRVQLIVGAGSNDTRQSISLMEEISQRIGPSTFLLTTGYYNKPTQNGIREHFEKIAQTFPTSNLILYNVPGRTGVNFSSEVVSYLANSYNNIIGIKEASGNLEQVKEIIDKTDNDNFRVVSGEDNLVSKIMEIGGFGTISATANIAPNMYRRLVDYAFEGNYRKAHKIQEQLEPVVEGMFSVTNPIPLAHVFNTHLRLPLCREESMHESIMDSLTSTCNIAMLGIDYRKYE